MEHIGTVVIYIIMMCAIVGAVASIYNPDSELGQEFNAGIHSIGPIFIPVAGIMAAIPFISNFIGYWVGPLFAAIGADPGIAGTALIASDLGGYQLAQALALSPEGWIIALITGFQSGSTIIFVIPVGLAMLHKADHKYMALGIMAGLLSVPISIALIALFIEAMGIGIRPDIATTGAASQVVDLSLPVILHNILPLILFCAVLAAALRFLPNLMVSLFLALGRLMYASVTLILVASIVEYFTGFFSSTFGSWGFDPIIADAEDQFRALEIAGYVGIMLCGAFPMVYLIKRFLSKPIEKVAGSVGLSPVGAAGILAASANVLAMFRLVAEMPAKDKVLVIAFAVSAAFTFGDHLAYSANFQPSIILPMVAGKLLGGVIGMALALWLAVPRALAMEDQDKQAPEGLPAARMS
ncbi:ethanolamine utilization protein EutH [Halomonas salifodinae]|uniref:Ethanolamine utilization protein EutH n=1 Tax=Halomonas salifodinae TaxID=438745 RepID=A0ABW2EXM5_9GAMM